MRRSIDAVGTPTDHGELPGQLRSEFIGRITPVMRSRPRTHDGDRGQSRLAQFAEIPRPHGPQGDRASGHAVQRLDMVETVQALGPFPIARHDQSGPAAFGRRQELVDLKAPRPLGPRALLLTCQQRLPHLLGPLLANQLRQVRLSGFTNEREGSPCPALTRPTPAHAAPPIVSTCRSPMAEAMSSAHGLSRPARSANVHATRNALSTPRALSRPLAMQSSIRSSPAGGGGVFRNWAPGTSTFVRQGVFASRRRWRSLASSTRARTTDELSGAGPAVRLRRDAPELVMATWMSTRSRIGPDRR